MHHQTSPWRTDVSQSGIHDPGEWGEGISNFAVHFRGLVLGCIEAEFCKEILNISTRWKALGELYNICMFLH